MDARLLIDSRWMVSAEFGTRGIPKEPIVTIAGVTREAQDKEGREIWPVMTFVEPWAKPLKINQHSKTCCMAMFGGETDKWTGRRLNLYAQAGTYFGEKGTAVRICGSPDITAPISVSVKKRGSRNPDVYNLKPTGEKTLKTYKPTGILQFGPAKGIEIAAMPLSEISEAIAFGEVELSKATPGATWIPKIQGNILELRAAYDQRPKGEPAEPGAAG